jgi:hypothetical protein
VICVHGRSHYGDLLVGMPVCPADNLKLIFGSSVSASCAMFITEVY